CAFDAAVGPSPAQPMRHQAAHCIRKVGVDDERVGTVTVAVRTHATDAPALEVQLSSRLAEAYVDAHPSCDTGHRIHDGSAAAARMEDAELVLQEREDREQARALERRHAEILALEGE